MGAKVSAEMIEAQRLIDNEGYSAYAAAKRVGLSLSAIYRTSWWKDRKNAKTSKGLQGRIAAK